MKFPLFKQTPLMPEEKRRLNRQRLAGILSGLLMGLSFPPVPFPATLLMFIGLVPYFQVLDKKEKLIDINRFTYLTFFVFNLLTIYWVGSWSSEADPFLMIGGVLLLFLNTSFFLIPSTLFYFASKFFSRRTAFLLFPFFWVGYEYAYMLTDASFPWLTLGNGMTYFLPFIQIADIVGALGLSLTAVFINVFIYLGIQEFKNRQLIIKNFYYASALVLFIVPLIYGFLFMSSYKAPARNINVGLIQPNINPWDKWGGGDLWSMTEEYFELSEKAITEGARVIFWPETALPVYIRDDAHRDVLDSIHAFVNRNNIYLLTGMPDYTYYSSKESAPQDAKFSKTGGFYYATYNSVMLFSPDTSDISRYGKMKLVPFGERVPFVDVFPFLGDFIKWNVGISGWNVGRDTLVFNVAYPKNTSLFQNANYTADDTLSINSLVCFESVYPDFVAGFTQKGAELISVVTNDSWYGNSSGPYQHKEIGVLRAIENRRSVVRAANGGISTIIDPLGRTLVQSKMYTRTFIAGNTPIETKITFFTRHPLIIPVISSAVSIWVIGLALLSKLKKWLKII